MKNKKAAEILRAIKAGTAHAFLNDDAITSALDTAIDALEKQEQDRWIPVKDRLPELESEVLVTDEYGEIRHADYSGWLGKAEFRTVEESMTLEDVKAWRPLPAPYQEDEA